jgi:hypothetical protein
MFGPRYGYGYGYAGGAFGRLLSFLCPMLLLLETLAVVVGLPSAAVRWLWIGLIATLALAAVVALALLVLGPWRNRFAGVWLGVVAGGTWWLSGPANAWAVQLSRYF